MLRSFAGVGWLGHFGYFLFALKRSMWITNMVGRPYPTSILECASPKGLNPEFTDNKQLLSFEKVILLHCAS